MKVIWEPADVADDMLLMILKIIDFKKKQTINRNPGGS